MGGYDAVRHTFVDESGADAYVGPTRVNAEWDVISTTVVEDFGGLHFRHVVRRPSDQLPWAHAALEKD